MLQRYNHFYLRNPETEDDNPAALPHPASSMDIVSSIMELEVPLEIRWRILDIFTHWDTHIARVLPLLKKTYDTLLSYADALEPYAQAFLSYWHPHIEELGGFCAFAESLFPVGSIRRIRSATNFVFPFSCLMSLGCQLTLWHCRSFLQDLTSLPWAFSTERI